MKSKSNSLDGSPDAFQASAKSHPAFPLAAFCVLVRPYFPPACLSICLLSCQPACRLAFLPVVFSPFLPYADAMCVEILCSSSEIMVEFFHNIARAYPAAIVQVHPPPEVIF
jgi:hypothetical protein